MDLHLLCLDLELYLCYQAGLPIFFPSTSLGYAQQVVDLLLVCHHFQYMLLDLSHPRATHPVPTLWLSCR